MMKYLVIAFSLLLSACTQVNPSNNGENISSSNPNTTIASQVLIPSPTFGSGKHAFTIYADFQCPACIAFSKLIGPILEEYAGKGFATITYKQFPLVNSHKNAERDAIAALCGAEQGKYMDFKKALYAMEEEKAGGKVSDNDRVNAAKGILDETKFAECLEANKYLPQVRAEMDEGNTNGVDYTPTVFLDGKKLDPKIYSNPEVLHTILDRLLEVPETASGETK